MKKKLYYFVGNRDESRGKALIERLIELGATNPRDFIGSTKGANYFFIDDEDIRICGKWYLSEYLNTDYELINIETMKKKLYYYQIPEGNQSLFSSAAIKFNRPFIEKLMELSGSTNYNDYSLNGTDSRFAYFSADGDRLYYKEFKEIIEEYPESSYEYINVYNMKTNNQPMESKSSYPKKMYIADLESSLKYKRVEEVLAEVEVEGKPVYITKSRCADNYFAWKFAKDIDEPKVLEVTMDEIAKKFNVNVEQLKIKK